VSSRAPLFVIPSAPLRHPERSEGSALPLSEMQIPDCARDDYLALVFLRLIALLGSFKLFAGLVAAVDIDRGLAAGTGRQPAE
jgi:hypothetical protein